MYGRERDKDESKVDKPIAASSELRGQWRCSVIAATPEAGHADVHFRVIK